MVEVERVVEKLVEPPPSPSYADLVVTLRNAPMVLDGDFGNYFVEETRKIPGVAQVSEGVVGLVHEMRSNGNVNDTPFMIQGWQPDNFWYGDLKVTAGRRLETKDRHKVLLGQKLAENLRKEVGDKVVFVADPEQPYEVVGICNSLDRSENYSAIVSLADGQALTGKRITGFSVRVAAGMADIDAVKQAIEALRDPRDTNARLEAFRPNRR
ncbi:MacB-like periplasmic core domain protein [Gemmata obscuriglobus]|uniref:ABC transporter permease n=1 Tax=Gemmata obscuriglobus TaxID=114 RepID=UPI000527CBC3|nr:ABC transporter permease [Gemmata obscuriglobus]QEG31015.1 MacB-like periplasmic core domain protein [Gemmata obscuriglobus]VTS10350.1 Uncharacterized protein OS=Oscillochloris trichoides DG-6 GN=OSCT_1742 PE=4 SV=1: MacB_PCD [Gemmata obscuriglobus UQM 2246]